MTKKEMVGKIKERGLPAFKSWTKARLEEVYRAALSQIIVRTVHESKHGGNWSSAKDWFPEIGIDQELSIVTVTVFDMPPYTKKCPRSTGRTVTSCVSMAPMRQSLYIRGTAECRNYTNPKCSGTQDFCFAVFRGDSGYIYVHRAPATKGWLQADPADILVRLRKLGIGCAYPLQQGDFLLKPAGRHELPAGEFKHEWNPAGHHKPTEPVLSKYVPDVGRIIFIPDGAEVTFIHHAVDGIQHPDLRVPPGQWIVGTTASSLVHPGVDD